MKVSIDVDGFARRLGGARAQHIADAAVQAAEERLRLRRLAQAAAAQGEAAVTDQAHTRR